MAARWIGLARSKQIKCKVAAKRRTIHQGLHAIGASGMLMMAAAMNFAMYPEALAEVVGGERQIIGFVPNDPSAGTSPLAPIAPVAVDETQVRLLASTVWGEARSEGELGMRAVAHVMYNRIGARFGEDIETVILTPRQFSVWNRGDPNRRLVLNPDRYATGGEALETWEIAQRVAREVLSGQSVDPTGGALFYHTRAVRPSWARYGQGRQVIGAHVFYSDVPDRATRRTPQLTRIASNVLRTIQTGMSGDDASALDEPVVQRGPRAGRVNGVIQYASPDMARQELPSEASTSDVNAAATPTINGVPVTTAAP